MHTDSCGSPWHRNIVQKEAEKKVKYKRMYRDTTNWNMKCKITPVIIRATRIVTKDTKKNLEAISGRHSTDSLKKTAILGTSHIIRKVLQDDG
jgi:hypothetical protein